MAAITATAAQVALVNETEAETRTYIAGVTITPGQAVYQKTTGKSELAIATSVAAASFVGIALRGARAGQPVNVVQRGSIIGLDLSGVAYGGLAYLSTATAGGLDTAAATGTGNVVSPVGRVLAMSDAALTKVLFVDAPLTTILTALP